MELDRSQIHTIIFYNWKRNLKAEDCLKEMSTAFGEGIVSLATIKRWYAEFRQGRQSLKEQQKSGRPKTKTTEEMAKLVQNVIKDNPRATYLDIQEKLGIGSEAINTLLHEKLEMKKVFSQFVPHLLTDAQKQQRVNISRKLLAFLRKNGGRERSKIVTGDETYFYYYDALTPQETKIWVTKDEVPPKVLKSTKKQGKILFAIFFRTTGLVKSVMLKEQKTVTSTWYKDIQYPPKLHRQFR